jgi:hypothetical protein
VSYVFGLKVFLQQLPGPLDWGHVFLGHSAAKIFDICPSCLFAVFGFSFLLEPSLSALVRHDFQHVPSVASFSALLGNSCDPFGIVSSQHCPSHSTKLSCSR